MTTTETIGIPYGRQEWDNGIVAVCPECDERIRLNERKDTDSMRGDEYADHYMSNHEGGK